MATTIADLVVKIGADIKGFQNSVKQMENEFSGIVNAGNKMKAIGGTLSTYVTAPILAAAGAAVKMAADVDKGVAEVITLFGLTGTEAEAMSKKMKEGIAGVSNEVGIAQTVITEGLYNAISAGVPEENVFDFMRVASQAAIAGVTDVNTAVDGITTAINAYGLSAEDAERVSDSMFATVQGGKTTFGELSAALFNVAPAAAAAGVSMEEVNAGIATLTASGVPTSVATTQLRAALTGLQRPSEDLNKIFQSLGYESAQVAIESEGLGFALDAVKTASNGNNGELQVLLGSVEAVAAANIIAGTGAEKFADELDRQAKAAGSTQKAFDVMQKSTAQQFQKTTTMLQNIAIALGDKLLPLFNSFLEVVQDVLLWFSELSDGWQNAIIVIGGIAAAVGPVLIVLGKLATLMPTIAAGFTLLTGPIGLVVAAIAALTAAAVAIYNNWDGISDWFEDIWHQIYMAHLLAAEKILGVVESLFGWIPGSEAMFAGLRTAVSNAIDAEEVRRRGQLVERAMQSAATETEALADEGGKADTQLGELGITGKQSADDIEKAMQGATQGVKSLADQVRDIMATLGSETEAGKRELAFLVKLDRKNELRVEIEELEQALKALANETTINVDDSRVIDLQTSLLKARNELDAMNQADAFKTKLQTAFRDLDMAAANSSDEIREVVRELQKLRESNTITADQDSYLVDLILDLQAASKMAEDTEAAFEDMLGMIELENVEMDGLIALYDELSKIDKLMTGSDALQAKIEAVNQALEDGSISWLEGQKMIQGYRDEIAELEKEQNSFENQIKRMAEASFPNAIAAFNSAKGAVLSFKSAFIGDNGKPFLQNIDEGLLQVRDTIFFAKNAMSEFGNVAGLAITGISALVPGLGQTVTSVLSILNTLGIDVGKILDDVTNKLLGFLKTGEGADPATAVLNSLKLLLNQAQTYLPDTDLSQVAGTVLSLRGETLQETQGMIASYLTDVFGEGLANPETSAFFENLIQQFVAAMTPFLSNIFAGQGGGAGGGGGQGYTQQQQKEFFDTYDNYYNSGAYSPLELWNIMSSMFGEAMTRALLGNPPAFAKGGLAFGEMLAMVGDNPNAGSDPEIISPLSKLNEMLVQPVLSQISSMMGGAGGMQQVVYVTLDGRIIAESVFYNMPDVVRVNTGALQ